MSDEKKELDKIVREERAWVEERYEKNPMDCWINGYRNALRTVLGEANRKK